jgi:hypothetical protein
LALSALIGWFLCSSYLALILTSPHLAGVVCLFLGTWLKSYSGATMDIATKAVSFVCAVLLSALPASNQIDKVLPYIQIAAATAVVVNNGSQIADRFKSSK